MHVHGRFNGEGPEGPREAGVCELRTCQADDRANSSLSDAVKLVDVGRARSPRDHLFLIKLFGEITGHKLACILY